MGNGTSKGKRNSSSKRKPQASSTRPPNHSVAEGEVEPLLPHNALFRPHTHSNSDVESAARHTHPVNEAERGPSAIVHENEDKSLKRDLSSRQLQLIALVGAIGMGLFLSLGGALQTGGPLGALLGYATVGLVIIAVQHALGEVSSLYPVTGAFYRHAEVIVDPALGFAIGWNVVYTNMISIPAEIAAILVLMGYFTDKHPVIILTTMILITFLTGIVGVGTYGNIEVVMSMLKILLIVGIVMISIIIDLGLTGKKPIGFQYWNNPGPFVEYLVSGNWGRFLGFWAVINKAVYSFSGVEDISMAAAETQSPRQNIPRACRKIFARVALFYLTIVFVIGLLVASNDPALSESANKPAQSPFVIVASRVGGKLIPAVINALIIAATWSSANASILTGTRVLYSLAQRGEAPKIFTKTTGWGSPYAAVLLQTLIATLSYTALIDGALAAFYYFLNLAVAGTLFSWSMILVNHILLRDACDKMNIDYKKLPWSNSWTPYSSRAALVACLLFQFTTGFMVFFPGHWNTGTFVSSYITIPIILILYLGGKVLKKSERTPLEAIPIREALLEIQEHPEEPIPAPKGWERLYDF